MPGSSSLPPAAPAWRSLLRRGGALMVAVVVTLVVFLVLPLTQSIRRGHDADLIVRDVEVANLPPPPPPPPEQEEPEPEEPPAPELMEEAPPLDLAQLELALNPGFGDGLTGDFAVKLAGQLAQGDELDQIFSLSDLDQYPRPIFQTPPTYPQELRRKGVEGTVYIVFLVDQRGSVVNATVEKSTDPRFERPALEAVKQWKFEPGMKNGKEVQFKMRVPITFASS